MPRGRRVTTGPAREDVQETERGTIAVRFQVVPVPPFRLDLSVWALRRHANNGIDLWDGVEDRRVIAGERGPVLVTVRQDGCRLDVTAEAGFVDVALEERVTGWLTRSLGTEIDLTAFYAMANRDPRLRALVDRFRGVKPPRFGTAFEGLLNAFSSQQLSLAAGLSILTALSSRCGQRYARGHLSAVPRPSDLANRRLDTIRRLGYSRAKARAIMTLAGQITQGDLDLDRLSALDNDAALAQLCDLHDVGRWTAEYVLLRGFGRLDVFPGDDVGAQNSLRRWLRLRRALDHAAIDRILAQWDPWRGVIYFHLLLSGLERAGCVSANG